MHIRKSFALSAILLFTSCTMTGPAATEAEKQLAVNGFNECISREYKNYDDGQSPADQVAVGIKGACRKEIEQIIVTDSKGMSEYAADEFRRLFTEGVNDLIIGKVLRYRTLSKSESRETDSCVDTDVMRKAVNPFIQCMVNRYIAFEDKRITIPQLSSKIVNACGKELQISEERAKVLTANCSEEIKQEFSNMDQKVGTFIEHRRKEMR